MRIESRRDEESGFEENGEDGDEVLLQSDRPEGVRGPEPDARVGPGWGASGTDEEDEISRTSDEDSLSEEECPDDLNSVVPDNFTCAPTFHCMGETPTLYDFSCVNTVEASVGVRLYTCC